jgi:hypothetical protein
VSGSLSDPFPGPWYAEADRPSAPCMKRLARARLLRREILGAVEPGERVDVEGVFWRLERRVEELTFAEVERELGVLREDGTVDLVSTGVYQRRAGAP